MLIRELVEHCAPTLAGLKAGSLFSRPCANAESLHRRLHALALHLPQDIRITLLRVTEGRALILVWHSILLAAALHAPDAQPLLHACGYTSSAPPDAIAHLRSRLGRSCFPHEIGLFLGYPPCDVMGFIRSGGKNCLFSGCWKVYDQPAAARQRFDDLRRCQALYTRTFSSGTPLGMLPKSCQAHLLHHQPTR